MSQSDLDQGSLYPPLSDVRNTSVHIAAAVAEVAYAEGLATVAKPADLPAFIQAAMYEPTYPTYR